MKVILYMATTVNGFIAEKNDDVDFVSKTSWQSYRGMVAATGNVIVGHRTFELMQSVGDLEGLTNVHVTVVGQRPKGMKVSPKISFAESPQAALEQVRGAGFEESLVAGGASLNASFLKENLVDEIYLDIEPVLLSQGIPLVNGFHFERQLKLIGTQQIAENEIQLHYQVIK